MSFISGVLVTSLPGRFKEALAAIARIPHTTVHLPDESSGRAVVVIDHETIAGEEETFLALRGISALADVSLIVHHWATREETADSRPDPPRTPDQEP